MAVIALKKTDERKRRSAFTNFFIRLLKEKKLSTVGFGIPQIILMMILISVIGAGI